MYHSDKQSAVNPSSQLNDEYLKIADLEKLISSDTPATESTVSTESPPDDDEPETGQTLDTACFSGPIRGLIEACVETHKVDPAIAAVWTLTTHAASLGHGIRLSTGGKGTAGNLFGVVCAGSGRGKTSTFDAAIEPLRAIQSERHGAFIKSRLPDLLAEREILEVERQKIRKGKVIDRNRLREIIARIAEIDTQAHAPTIYTGDFTTQSLIETASRNGGSIGIFNDDAGTVLDSIYGRWNSTGRTDESALLRMFSGQAPDMLRRGNSVIAPRECCLSLGIGMTPKDSDKLFESSDFLNGGFLARCIVAQQTGRPIERSIRDSRSIPESMASKWESHIRANCDRYLFRNPDAPFLPVILTSDAIEIFDELNHSVHQRWDARQDTEAFDIRATELAMRISLNLHVSEHGSEAPQRKLSGSTAQGAVAFYQALGRCRDRLLSKTIHEGKLERSKRLRDILEAKGRLFAGLGKGCTLRELLIHHGVDEGMARSIVNDFPTAFGIDTYRSGKAGQPAKVCYLREG